MKNEIYRVEGNHPGWAILCRKCDAEILLGEGVKAEKRKWVKTSGADMCLKCWDKALEVPF